MAGEDGERYRQMLDEGAERENALFNVISDNKNTPTSKSAVFAILRRMEF